MSFLLKKILLGLLKLSRVTLAAIASGVVFTLLYHLAADPLEGALPEFLLFMAEPLRAVVENGLLVILLLFVCFFCFRDMNRREVIVSALALCVYYTVVVGLEQSLAANMTGLGISARLIDIVPGRPWWIVPFAMPLTVFRHLRALLPDYGGLMLGMTSLFPMLYALLAWCRGMKRSPLRR